MVYGAHFSPLDFGFALNTALLTTNLIEYWIRNMADLEVEANRSVAVFRNNTHPRLVLTKTSYPPPSLERIHQHLTIEHEKSATSAGAPPAAWPTSGSVSVQKLSARYAAGGPDVLHEIAFEVRSGEKIGIGQL